jgi:hypothetical protein
MQTPVTNGVVYTVHKDVTDGLQFKVGDRVVYTSETTTFNGTIAYIDYDDPEMPYRVEHKELKYPYWAAPHELRKEVKSE